ncbi:MAG: bifunctional demethylmenaquinone methyltransferase/2-methoxy-6-polyprenyl-1,4-benzoquinol methylase UbiE [Bacteroidaceae bacterium]|nr:bifunctional demethylmenaquinone methyltransferase/2-methoxy-6-polyprenyl-1,4-benzoquinol methylase UbiE [Bacteroidaceae bacterium]
MYDQELIKPYDQDRHKSEQVEEMFDHIAHSYDQLNLTLSIGIDRLWRRKAIKKLQAYHPKHILDVATGTGDFAILASRLIKPQEIIGIDISEGMMAVGREKVKLAGLDAVIRFKREDCTALSFEADSFDAITVAFGVRNFDGLDKGLEEMHRVMKQGGQLVILELSSPTRFPMKQLYRFYSKTAMPLIGKLISKDDSAYTYLPQSIEACPQGEQMAEIINRAGFNEVEYEPLTFGICTLYTATK